MDQHEVVVVPCYRHACVSYVESLLSIHAYICRGISNPYEVSRTVYKGVCVPMAEQEAKALLLNRIISDVGNVYQQVLEKHRNPFYRPVQIDMADLKGEFDIMGYQQLNKHV